MLDSSWRPSRRISGLEDLTHPSRTLRHPLMRSSHLPSGQAAMLAMAAMHGLSTSKSFLVVAKCTKRGATAEPTKSRTLVFTNFSTVVAPRTSSVGFVCSWRRHSARKFTTREQRSSRYYACCFAPVETFKSDSASRTARFFSPSDTIFREALGVEGEEHKTSMMKEHKKIEMINMHVACSHLPTAWPFRNGHA